MPSETITIGTRASRLAMAQSGMVAKALSGYFPGVEFKLKQITTKGDVIQDRPIASLDRGIFTKELEDALLNGACDMAVHSVKDMPVDNPAALEVAAVTKRENAQDVLVSRHGRKLEELPDGAIVGTSSPGRVAQLLRLRPGLVPREIRGNIDTRIRKMQEGGYDALILAAAGLIRLGLETVITQYLPFSMMLPAAGQGALALQVRKDDERIKGIAWSLNDANTRACVDAERSFLKALGGGCRVPISAYARIDRNKIRLCGLVANTDGKKIFKVETQGGTKEALGLGEKLAAAVVAAGVLAGEQEGVYHAG